MRIYSTPEELRELKQHIEKALESQTPSMAPLFTVMSIACAKDIEILERLPLTNRGTEWFSFYGFVLQHIENYTIPQYGDKPNDQLHTEWGIEDCMLAMKKYANRYASNSRGQEESKRDLLKIAHYACVAYFKMIEK